MSSGDTWFINLIERIAGLMLSFCVHTLSVVNLDNVQQFDVTIVR